MKHPFRIGFALRLRPEVAPLLRSGNDSIIFDLKKILDSKLGSLRETLQRTPVEREFLK